MTANLLQTLAILPNIGGAELFIIFFVILLLFGAKRLPELFRSFGKSIGEFKKATREIESDFRNAMDDEPARPPHRPAPRHDAESAPKAKETETADKSQS